MAVRDSELASGRTADAPTLEYADTTSVAARLSGQKRRGWWLLAILIPLGAVGVAMVIPSFALHDQDELERRVMRQVIDPSGPLANALNDYRTETGRYPSALSELIPRSTMPSATQSSIARAGLVPAALNDWWGRPLQYKFPGAHNPAGYDLWSLGRDGVDGTADEIANW